jgi:hypothetical protein
MFLHAGFCGLDLLHTFKNDTYCDMDLQPEYSLISWYGMFPSFGKKVVWT